MPVAPARRPGFLARRSPGEKAALYLGGGALTFLLLCCGGGTVLAGLGDSPADTSAAAGQSVSSTSAPPPAPAAPVVVDSTVPEPTAGEDVASPTEPAGTPSPVVETKTETKTEQIPFAKTTVQDANLAAGTRKVRTKGVPGTKTITYEVTYTDGVATGRKVLRSEVTRKPVTEVVAIGTRQPQKPKCDPNYSGCVPIASDVDCAGGGGDGPAYVSGPIRVIGTDIYRLDRDGDGVACED